MTSSKFALTSLSMALLLAIISSTAIATTSAMFDKEHAKPEPKEFSPYVNRGYPTNVYFGDTHLHTSYSPDAFLMGNQSADPDTA